LQNIKLTVNPVALNVTSFVDQLPYKTLQLKEINRIKKDQYVTIATATEIKLNVYRRYHLIAKEEKYKDLLWQLNANCIYFPERYELTVRAMNLLSLKIYKFITLGFSTQVGYTQKPDLKKKKTSDRLAYGYKLQIGFQL
jgi:hypothetical protein